MTKHKKIFIEYIYLGSHKIMITAFGYGFKKHRLIIFADENFYYFFKIQSHRKMDFDFKIFEWEDLYFDIDGYKNDPLIYHKSMIDIRVVFKIEKHLLERYIINLDRFTKLVANKNQLLKQVLLDKLETVVPHIMFVHINEIKRDGKFELVPKIIYSSNPIFDNYVYTNLKGERNKSNRALINDTKKVIKAKRNEFYYDHLNRDVLDISELKDFRNCLL